MNIIKQLIWWAKKVPCTLLILLSAIITGITTKALWISADTSGITEQIGYGLPAFREGDYISVVIGAFVAPAPWMYALILIPLAIGGGYLEYKHGALRMLVALFVTHIGAVFAVALLLLLLEPRGYSWVLELSAVRDVGLSNAAFGAVGAATAALSRAWRVRTRTFLVIYCLAFLLFSGVIWDLTHFAGLLIGFVIGPWVVERPIKKLNFHLDKQEKRSLVAVLVVFFVITRLVSKLYPGNGGLLAFHSPGQEYAFTMLLTVGLSVVSIVVAYGLYAGRKVAWWLMTGMSILFIASSIHLPVHPAIIFNTILSSVVLILLVLFRDSFDVKPDKIIKGRIYRGLAVLGGSLLIFNALAIYAIRSSFAPQPSFIEAIGESIYQIIGISSRSFYPQTQIARIFTDSISLMWATAVIIGVAALIVNTYRARERRGLFDEYDALLHEKGSSTIGWMARWPGMHYWVNVSRTAGFAYRLENNIAIVLSDPVGSRQAVSSAFESFEAMCHRRGWNPIYYAVSEQFLHSVRKQKLKTIVVGEDTVINVKNLEFTGKKWQSIRSALNRATKDGINMRVINFNEAPIGLRDQLKSIAAGWVQDKSLPEMGFTLGTLKEAEDDEVRMHIAVDQDGTVHGMTSWFPVYKNGLVVGWTIDIMQRRLDDHTMPGVIEFLIAESALAFKQEGYEFISLSVAPLSHGSGKQNSIEKLLDIIAERMEPYYGFKSLYNYKKKFSPEHRPMYLGYHDEARLPAIAFAITKAYMPNNATREVLASKIKH